jgi:ribonuclease R
MLPNNLSENNFSLICNKKRRVITVEFVIDTNGDFSNNKLPLLYYEIYPSTIIVKNRYNYDDVLHISQNNQELLYLKNIAEKYYKRRLNITQPTYNLDNYGNLTEISYENMNSWSHTLIEMMMINANRIVTEHMNKYNVKIPQRIHPEPLSLSIDDMITGDELIDSIIMIQKYKNASYDKDKNGHYGLNLENYTHFTSPIRRYNDIIVMRMIEGYIYENLDDLLKHINEREFLNSSLEKLYKKWKLMSHLSNHNNTIFEAYIVNLTKVGIKFYIKNIGYDGFIHIKYIDNELFKTFFVGKIIQLKCTKIDFTSFNDIFWNIC